MIPARKLRLANEPSPFGSIIGSSEEIQRAITEAWKFARSDYSVIILGETGTGKELFARAIHDASSRAGGPFIVVNCAAIPDNLFEAELFGHEKGSFTGAEKSVAGKAELADGGTLFLDEIAELPLCIQPKLLRFLEDHILERIGERNASKRKLDIRVILATNCDLKKAISNGQLRFDLFHRLGLEISLPSLRDRGHDALELAHHFLKQINLELGSRARFDRSAMEAIPMHSWPGNVRELIKRLRKGALIAEGGRITDADLGIAAEPDMPEAPVLSEKERIRQILLSVKWNKTQAAQILHWSRMTLYRKLRQYQIVK